MIGVVPPDRVPTASSAGPEAVRYAEVLRVPLRWWALGTMFQASVLVAFAVAMPLPVAVAAVAFLVLVMTAAFVGYGRARLVVTDRTFQAGRARISLALLADPRALSSEETWNAAGPGADARAYLVLRPYLRESVIVHVADPADPAPYWLVSTRRPAQLAAALTESAGGHAEGEPTTRGVSGQGHGAQCAEPDPGDLARRTD